MAAEWSPTCHKKHTELWAAVIISTVPPPPREKPQIGSKLGGNCFVCLCVCFWLVFTQWERDLFFTSFVYMWAVWGNVVRWFADSSKRRNHSTSSIAFWTSLGRGVGRQAKTWNTTDMRELCAQVHLRWAYLSLLVCPITASPPDVLLRSAWLHSALCWP